jgi:hypothetical protein
MSDIELQISGRNEGFLRSLEDARAAAQRTGRDVRTAFDQVADVFGKVQRAVLGFTAVLAGGGAFKATIDRTVELNVEAQRLGRTLGISATDATVLAKSLGDIFLTTEEFATAARGLTQTLRSNEDAVTGLGVATRDASGNLRNQLDIMLDVNKRLAGLKEGTDRNIEGSRIYGKSWQELGQIVQLQGDRFAAAEAKARSFNLVATVESVAATNAYRAAMDDVGDVMDGLGKVIAEAVMPALTAMGRWFGEVGPQLVTRFRAFLVPIQTGLIGLRLGFQVVFESISGTLQSFWALLSGFANAVARVLVFDFKGAKTAWQAGWDEMGRIGGQMLAKIVADSQAANREIAGILENAINPGGTDIKTPDAGGAAGPGDTKRLPEFTARLEEMKVAFAEEARARGQFLDFGLERERAYWREILQVERLSQDERLAIRTKVAQLSLAIDKAAFDGELAQLRAREAEFRANADARLEVAQEIAARLAAAYGQDSKQYQDAARRVVDIERDKQAQLRQIREIRADVGTSSALAQVEAEAEVAAALTDLGLQTNAELIAQDQAFEERRYEIRRQGLQERLALAEADPDRDPVRVAQLNAEIEELAMQHESALRGIRSAGLKEQTANWRAMFGTMQSGFASVIQNFLKGTLTIGNAVRGLFVAVAESVVQMLAQVAAQWLANAILQRVIGKATASSTIVGQAAAAGAGGVASMAAAPFPINLGAPAFGAAMAAAAMAYQAAIPAAAGGFDVPAGMNPVTQLHQREMVLPASLADGVREMVGQGGGGRGGAVTVHVSAIDGKSTADWLRGGGAAQIAKAVRAEMGKFNPDLRGGR